MSGKLFSFSRKIIAFGISHSKNQAKQLYSSSIVVRQRIYEPKNRIYNEQKNFDRKQKNNESKNNFFSNQLQSSTTTLLTSKFQVANNQNFSTVKGNGFKSLSGVKSPQEIQKLLEERFPGAKFPLKVDFTKPSLSGGDIPVAPWKPIGLKENYADFKALMDGEIKRNGYSSERQHVFGLYASPGSSLLRFLAETGYPDTVFIPISFGGMTPLSLDSGDPLNVVEDDPRSAIAIRFLRSAFFQSDVVWGTGILLCFGPHMSNSMTLFQLVQLLYDSIPGPNKPKRFVITVDEIMKLGKGSTAALQEIMECMDTCMDQKSEFRVFVVASSISKYPFLQISGLLNIGGSRRPIDLIKLYHPTPDQLLDIFLEHNNLFGKKCTKEEIMGLIFFCGGHFRSLTELYKAIQHARNANYSDILNDLINSTELMAIRDSVSFDAVRVALIGQDMPSNLHLQSYEQTKDGPRKGLFPLSWLISHEVFRTSKDSVLSEDFIQPLMSPLTMLIWTYETLKKNQAAVPEIERNVATLLQSLLKSIPVLIKLGFGFEKFHLGWEAIWRLVAPGFLPPYSGVSYRIVPQSKTLESELKEDDFGNFDLLKNICSPEKQKFKALDGWTHEQVLLTDDKTQTCRNILNQFLVPHFEKDENGKFLLNEIGEKIQISRSLRHLSSTIIPSQANEKLQRFAILFQTYNPEGKSRYLSRDDVTKKISKFFGLTSTKKILLEAKTMFVVIAWRQVTPKVLKAIESSVKNVQSVNELVVCDVVRLKELYGPTFNELGWCFNSKITKKQMKRKSS